MIHELNNLMRPFADMYIFNVVYELVIGEKNERDIVSWGFILGSVVFMAIALFLDPEHRRGNELTARLLYIAVVAGAILYDQIKERRRKQAQTAH